MCLLLQEGFTLKQNWDQYFCTLTGSSYKWKPESQVKIWELFWLIKKLLYYWPLFLCKGYKLTLEAAGVFHLVCAIVYK